MAVIKVEKKENYTVMSNYHFKEKNMSLKAKGLLSLMLSLPDDWDYSVAGLVTLSSDGETAVRSALKELEKFGYLTRRTIRKDGRIVDVEYIIYEKPLENTEEKLEVENHIQVNNRQLNTKTIKKLNNKDIYSNFENQDIEILKSQKKYKILSSIAMLCDMYDINDLAVISDLEKFYKILIDNNRIVNDFTIKADLEKLAKVSTQKQKETIIIALAKGWKSLNPDWLNNLNNRQREHNTGFNQQTQEEHLEDLKQMQEDNNFNF